MRFLDKLFRLLKQKTVHFPWCAFIACTKHCLFLRVVWNIKSDTKEQKLLFPYSKNFIIKFISWCVCSIAWSKRPVVECKVAVSQVNMKWNGSIVQCLLFIIYSDDHFTHEPTNPWVPDLRTRIGFGFLGRVWMIK